MHKAEIWDVLYELESGYIIYKQHCSVIYDIKLY